MAVLNFAALVNVLALLWLYRDERMAPRTYVRGVKPRFQPLPQSLHETYPNNLMVISQ